MHIAILSDTHSRLATVSKALQILRDRKIHTVLHCGDIECPETVSLFTGFDAHFVYGNCDHDKKSLERAIAQACGTLHGHWGQLEREGIRIAFTHGDDGRLLRDLEQSGHFDYVFHGHTHQAREHRVGPTRVINPGALHRANPKTFILLDLPAGTTESIVVE
jgi:putative phosphoesterase